MTLDNIKLGEDKPGNSTNGFGLQLGSFWSYLVSNKDFFSALAKYGSGEDENYLTESFALVINALLQQEPQIGVEILSRLCVNENEFSFDLDEDISIATQEPTPQGIPDIKVSSPNKLIYVEVKDYSRVDPNQLKHYRTDLESSNATIKRLILLTRFPVDFSEHRGIPDRRISWFEVYNWFADVRQRAQDPVSVYLIESFMSFLEVKRMSIEKVGWEYIDGVPAFNNLINMIESAIKDAKIPLHKNLPRATAWAWKGFWLEEKKFWCGIYYSAPSVVVFKAFNKEDLDVGRVKLPSYPVKEALRSLWFQLRLEDVHFFSLDKDRQLQEITKFIKTSYSEANRMRN